jgi:hypothetical protein
VFAIPGSIFLDEACQGEVKIDDVCFGRKIRTFIGACALGIITRIMGLILAFIGTQMVITGAREAFRLPG